MKTSPVSFGSILTFTINDGLPKADIKDMVKISFENNSDLFEYNLIEDKYDENIIDNTIRDASANFAMFLDRLYQDRLPKGSKDVIFTEVEFMNNRKKIEKHYYLTAATGKDESKINKILGQGTTMFSAKFYNKK